MQLGPCLHFFFLDNFYCMWVCKRTLNSCAEARLVVCALPSWKVLNTDDILMSNPISNKSNLQGTPITRDGVRHFSNRCDIYKVAKVVHGNRSGNHCNCSDTWPCILIPHTHMQYNTVTHACILTHATGSFSVWFKKNQNLSNKITASTSDWLLIFSQYMLILLTWTLITFANPLHSEYSGLLFSF